MDLFDLTPDDRLALTSACLKEGLDATYASFVARHLQSPDAAWRWCCGSNCDPCVQALGRAVDRARRALCVSPPVLPDDRTKS